MGLFGSFEQRLDGLLQEKPMIEIVTATRFNQRDFWEKSALGISLKRLSKGSRLIANITFENQQGLPIIYNQRIQSPDSQDMLVFTHDDVWIDDFFLPERIRAGLKNFHILGVAGNRRRISNQNSWCFINNDFIWDTNANLSGSIAHGKKPFGAISRYGETPAECELLDGVFLAVNKKMLLAHQILFDPQFDFHFYDMDFCRSAKQKGLKIGTWPICLTHQSGGVFGSKPWSEKYELYLQKWGN